MEGSESEAVFDSLNLNPQLFINEVINNVEDLVDDAFNHFHQQASALLKTEETDRAQDLSKGFHKVNKFSGVNIIRKMVQSTLDDRLAMWEQHCLNHFFQVPEGFVLPKSDESPPVDTCVLQNAICDPDLDAQLDLLRSKLTKVSKENSELKRELQSLERQSGFRDHVSELSEIMQLYDQNNFREMFQEMVNSAPDLRMKIGKLKTRELEETKRRKIDRIYNPRGDPSIKETGCGFSNAKLEDLQAFLENMTNK